MYRILFCIVLICLSVTSQGHIYASSVPPSVSIFRELGIELSAPIADTYYVGDGILVRGRVIDANQHALIFIKNIKTGESISELATTNTKGEFEMPISLSKSEGDYMVIIASGNSFNTTIHKNIRLVSNKTLLSSKILRPIPVHMVYAHSPYLSIGSGIWASMNIEQGKKSTKTQGQILSLGNLPVQYGPAKISLQGYMLSGPSSLDQNTSSGVVWTGSVFIDRTRELIGSDLVSFRRVSRTIVMQFRIPSGKQVKSQYYVTTPSGDVIEYHFPVHYIANDGYLKTNVLIRQNLQIPETGVSKIETVSSNGYAYFNLPISNHQFWSIIPPLLDTEISTLRIDRSVIVDNTLKHINSIRIGLGRVPVALDTTLSNLAQYKAADMASYKYVGHTTHMGLDIIAFAQSQGISISGTIGENVAGGNVSDMSLQDGLEESGSHRYNMIDPDWGHVGIGYVLKDGRTYLVEIFGE